MPTAAAILTLTDRARDLAERGRVNFRPREIGGKGPGLTLVMGAWAMHLGSSTDTATVADVRFNRYLVLERVGQDAQVLTVPPLLRRNEVNAVWDALCARTLSLDVAYRAKAQKAVTRIGEQLVDRIQAQSRRAM